jgi:hypothetical protein
VAYHLQRLLLLQNGFNTRRSLSLVAECNRFCE